VGPGVGAGVGAGAGAGVVAEVGAGVVAGVSAGVVGVGVGAMVNASTSHVHSISDVPCIWLSQDPTYFISQFSLASSAAETHTWPKL